jgi:hypothetical protein
VSRRHPDAFDALAAAAIAVAFLLAGIAGLKRPDIVDQLVTNTPRPIITTAPIVVVTR